jgi:hypothetical protein
MAAAARKRGREIVAPNPQPIRLPGLSELNIKKAEKYMARNWNGEDPSIRVSPRVKVLNDQLFPGASLIDDCSRSSNRRLLILGLRLTLRETFQAFELGMLNGKVTDEAHFKAWQTFVYASEGKQKNSQAFWELNFYQDRAEEHIRLKQSLIHPSPHYTFDALKCSWVGERAKMGHFGNINDLVHNSSTNTSSVFGISRAL